MSESDDAVGAIFDGALQRPPGQRAAYVRGACAGDLILQERVEALLLALESAGAFMTGPAVAPPPGSAPVADVEPGNPPSAPREPMAQAPADDAVGQTVGRCQLLEKIGEGGCGVVYLAEQKEPVRRHVALKVIKLGMDTRQVILRFEAERQALALMDHPNIAKVLDGGSSETGRPYFVMELVRGIPITQYCDQAHLTTRQRLDLFIQVCQAIQHAHQKGIVHRDIKPSNILVTLHDGVPVPKVIDFGIAKAIEGRLTDGTIYTQLHQFMGTPAYMSPEQAELTGLDIDTRSDIYSLGVLLYELLAGCTPFEAQELLAAGLEAMRRIIREQEPMRPSTRLMQLQGGGERTPFALRQSPLPSDLDWIVMKCLEKDRSRRYETANGLAFDLKRHLNNEPVLARPPSAAYRIQKAFRRHRLIFSAVTGIAVALVAGIGVSAWQTLVARRAQREAEAARGSELKVNELLRVQVGETERAQRSAEAALQLMQMRKAEELFEARQAAGALRHLGNVLRSNPSHEVAGARLAAAMLRPFAKELTEPLQHHGAVSSAQFSPDSYRIVTASDDGTARVWDARTGRPITEPVRHQGNVRSAEFSPDGQWVVTASWDHTARVWDARTGQPVTAPFQHQNGVNHAQFSPDGLRVVTASLDHTARVWDARTGQPLTEPLRHGEVVWNAQFSRDGLLVATASFDHTARVWNVRSGQPVTEPIRHDAGGGLGVWGARFSPDGLRLVTVSDNGTAGVWDTLTGKPVFEPILHQGPVRAAEFSPDGLQLVTSGHDGTACIWDTLTGRRATLLFGHSGEVVSARFSADGLRVVTASHDGTAQIWDARSGQPTTEPLRHDRELLSAQFSPDGLRVVTACRDGAARIWDSRTDGRPTEPPRLDEAVNSAQFSPDGLQVATATRVGVARIWDTRTHRLVTEPLRHDGAVNSARFSPDGLRVVTASDDQTVRVWHARTSEPLTNPFGHTRRVRSAQFSSDGLRILTVCEDETARIWDAQTGQPLTGLIRDPNLRYAELSPDGTRLATAGAVFATGSAARIWDAFSGQPLTEPLVHDGFVVSARFSPDGLRVVTASHDFTAQVWDIRTGQRTTQPLKHRKQVSSARFSPDGLWVVTASEDKTARVWDAQTGQPVTAPLQHQNGVSHAQFSSDGLRVVTASLDHTARVWDVRTGQPVSEPLRHDGAVAEAQFSPDGWRVLTVSPGGTARLWDVEPPPLPVPDWFLDWAETRVGHRFANVDGVEGIPFAEQESQRERVRSRTDTGFYTRLAQWVEADSSTRPSSPHVLPRPSPSTSPDSAP